MMASRVWNCGRQPSSRLIFSDDAIRRGGSPGRRGFSTTGIGCPVILRQVVDHFAHAGAAAGAEIVKSALRRLEREDVRVRQIEDVNVIANAGAVGRFVIGPVNFDVRFLSQARP